MPMGMPTTFKFEVFDGTVYNATQSTKAIDVTEVNDLPTSRQNHHCQ